MSKEPNKEENNENYEQGEQAAMTIESRIRQLELRTAAVFNSDTSLL
jgi:hypothetical protein